MSRSKKGTRPTLGIQDPRNEEEVLRAENIFLRNIWLWAKHYLEGDTSVEAKLRQAIEEFDQYQEPPKRW